MDQSPKIILIKDIKGVNHSKLSLKYVFENQVKAIYEINEICEKEKYSAVHLIFSKRYRFSDTITYIKIVQPVPNYVRSVKRTKKILYVKCHYRTYISFRYKRVIGGNKNTRVPIYVTQKVTVTIVYPI